jgi:DNA invertase Pin-like site-specific DNA recombinase
MATATKKKTTKKSAAPKAADKVPPTRPKAPQTFTKQAVMAIRKEYDKGSTYRKLAEAHGVSVTTIQNIVLGITYVDVGGPLQDKSTSGQRRGARLRAMTPAQVKTAKSMLKKGETLTAAAAELSVSPATVRKYVS